MKNAQHKHVSPTSHFEVAKIRICWILTFFRITQCGLYSGRVLWLFVWNLGKMSDIQKILKSFLAYCLRIVAPILGVVLIRFKPCDWGCAWGILWWIWWWIIIIKVCLYSAISLPYGPNDSRWCEVKISWWHNKMT